jgi:hypothetical protein
LMLMTQHGGTILPKLLRVLRKLCLRLDDRDLNWAVVGSLGLALRGAPIEPRDIDIMTDEAGAYELERVFSEFVVSPVSLKTSDRIRSHFGALNIDGVKVEIMGDFQMRLEDGTWDLPPDMMKIRHTESVEGMAIPFLPLQWQYDSYSKLGRSDRAEAVLELMRG